jgi:hypothetical protein
VDSDPNPFHSEIVKVRALTARFSTSGIQHGFMSVRCGAATPREIATAIKAW